MPFGISLEIGIEIGTDFTPVFAHADKLAEAGETVDAVIYITDGWGEFPEYETKPPYEVFLLLDIEEEWEMDGLELPDWAETIVMNQTENNYEGTNELYRKRSKKRDKKRHHRLYTKRRKRSLLPS